MKETPQKIIRLRKRLDEIDYKLLEVLAERFKITDEIGRHKKRHGIEVVDPAREKKHFANLPRLAEELELDEGFASQLMRLVIDESVKRQRALPDQD